MAELAILKFAGCQLTKYHALGIVMARFNDDVTTWPGSSWPDFRRVLAAAAPQAELAVPLALY